MSLLESITGPADVRRLSRDQLQPLADEVRRRLIDVVSQTGGHIGAGLGVVELTVADAKVKQVLSEHAGKLRVEDFDG